MAEKEHHRPRGTVLAWTTAIAATHAMACVREPAEGICPAVGRGDLVVTELRGPQSSPDTQGQWIELVNTTTQEVDLRGLRLRMLRLDGGGEVVAILRDEALLVAPQAYFVIGHHDPDRLPSFVDTTIFADYFSKSSTTGLLQPRDLYPDAVIELIACDTEVDRMHYRDLPRIGTLAFDGAKLPTADANDDLACWCNDRAEAPPNGPQTDLGVPGTPGAPNPPC